MYPDQISRYRSDKISNLVYGFLDFKSLIMEILTDYVNSRKFLSTFNKSSFTIDLNIQIYFKLRNKYFEIQ